MKRTAFLFSLALIASLPALAAPEAKHDKATVQNYIAKVVGKETIDEIKKREGGAAFLQKFFSDVDWMEQFAGSGIFNPDGFPGAWKNGKIVNNAQTAFKALDVLYYNDKPLVADGKNWMETKLGRNATTALALDHGGDFSDEKLVEIADYYRDWDKNGTLHKCCYDYDVRQWREIMAFGQNDMLSPGNLKWIHEFATVPWGKYYGTCWECHYRLWNCFGASVHGSDYYRPWEHRWVTQQLRYRVGGVCGGLSKFGSHNAASHGVRSYTAGQPGHCAFMLWNVDEDRWDHAYSVTGHTGQHFRLNTDTHRFPAAEEQDRYYQNPKRMAAEYLRWKGDYKASMKMANNNWQAADEWRQTLKTKQDWDEWADTVMDTFTTAPCLGFALLDHYMEFLGKQRDAKIACVEKAFTKIHEYTGKTPESVYLDEAVLDPLAKRFDEGDTKAYWKIFNSALDSYAADNAKDSKDPAKKSTFFRQTINWGSTKLMSDKEGVARYLKTVGAAALKYGAELDYRGMIRAASEAGDVGTFQQCYKLMDRLPPKNPKTAGELAKSNGNKFPEKDYGGDLLSQDGLLQTESTCGYDQPIRYRNALDAADFSQQNAFHTDGSEKPWAQVLLKGETLVAGVTVIDRATGVNGARQVPMEVLISTDGVAWEKVATDKEQKQEYKFNIGGKKAKYVRVQRSPDVKKEPFHLHKILVYGTKQY